MAGLLPAVTAEEGLCIQPGRIYVATPDLHHLAVGHGSLHLAFSP
jgi:hypothetical protein